MEYQKRVVTFDVVHGGETTTVQQQPYDDGIKTADIRIPFHAIDRINVKSELQTVTRPDPYGCDGGGDDPITPTTVYGVMWDGGESSKWSRTDASASFSDPNPAVANGTGSSPFDKLMPWSGMQIVEDEEAGTLVSIPKYWYKWTRDGASMKLQISDKQKDGFSVSPAHADRGDGVGERDMVYVARYFCSDSNYKSVSGIVPKVNEDKVDFASSIHRIGHGVWQFDFAMYWTIAMLYLVEYADWDSQECIGYGCGGYSVAETGQTDSMQYHTGTVASERTGYGDIQYRHIEGLWSNVYSFIDGIYFVGESVYVLTDPASYGVLSGGTLIGTRQTASGNIVSFNEPPSGFEYALYPTNASGTDYSKFICDSCLYGSGSKILYFGGSYDLRSKSSGLFHFRGDGVLSKTASYLGSRLQKLPQA